MKCTGIKPFSCAERGCILLMQRVVLTLRCLHVKPTEALNDRLINVLHDLVIPIEGNNLVRAPNPLWR
jgi:hypothetical protein